MDKTKLGAGSYLLPMPVVLVGANVNDRPNFLTIAYVGIVSHTPAMIEIALRKNRFSSAGIKKNQTFSVNAASTPWWTRPTTAASTPERRSISLRSLRSSTESCRLLP